jgi:predicted nucleic-acid-binding protein
MDVPTQTLAIQRLMDSGKPYEISDAAIIELVYVLEAVYKLDRSIIYQVIKTIFTQPHLRCSRELFEAAFESYLEYAQLSIVDCYLSACADIKQSIPLLTFDKALAKKLPLQASLVPSDVIADN